MYGEWPCHVADTHGTRLNSRPEISEIVCSVTY